MGRLSQNYRNSRSTAKQGKQLEKSNSSPVKESNKIAKMNSRIEKEAKKNLNEIDSFDNLFTANNNFLQDLYYDQSVKNANQCNDLSGWQGSEALAKQFQVETFDRQGRFDKFNINDSTNITERQSKRAVSANFAAGQTPLISRRKITKQILDQNTYASAQKQSKNEIGSEIFPLAPQQSAEKKCNSFSSPQVLLSNLISSNQRFSATPKLNAEQQISSFEQNESGNSLKKQQDQQHPQRQLQNSGSKNHDNIFKNTVSEWKTYLDRYDSSSDLYNVNLTKKRLSAMQSLDDQNEEIFDFDNEDNNTFIQFHKQEKHKQKTKNANLSIDISQIRIAASNNQSIIEDGKFNQNYVQSQNSGCGYQVNQQTTNPIQQNQKDLSSRQTYRTSKSSQANRIFGKKKKSRLVNMSAIHSNVNTQQQYQLNHTMSKMVIPKDIKLRNYSSNLVNNITEENTKSSSSSLNEGQNIANMLSSQLQQPYQPQNLILNENENLLQKYNQSNSSSQSGLKQRRIPANQSLLEEDEYYQQQYSTLNPNISTNAYQPQEFLSSKNTLAYFVQSNQNTTPQNKYLDNQDLKNVFYQILTKSNEEKDQLLCNKSQILKSISNNYQPKRSQNYSSVNAAQQLGKEKIKQVIQQKNNQRVLKQLQNSGNMGGGTQSLNHSLNLGQVNNKVLCDAGNFQIIRNNKDSNKDDYIVKNTETNEKLIIHVPHNKMQIQMSQSAKKQDENSSSQNIKKMRAKSVIKNEEIESVQKPQQYALFTNKKQFFEQTSRVLRPTVQNILAATNENNTSNKFNPILNNSYCVKISDKLTPKNNQTSLNNSDKKSINNKIYNSGHYSNLLSTKF